jgi:hypothetical protein
MPLGEYLHVLVGLFDDWQMRIALPPQLAGP